MIPGRSGSKSIDSLSLPGRTGHRRFIPSNVGSSEADRLTHEAVDAQLVIYIKGCYAVTEQRLVTISTNNLRIVEVSQSELDRPSRYRKAIAMQ